MKRSAYLLLSAGLLALLGAGCSTYKQQAQSMTSAWRAGRVTDAARDFGSKADKAGISDAIVWHLEAATAYRATGDFTNSNRHFDEAAALMDEFDGKAKVKLGTEAAAIMSNQQNLPYRGKLFDRIMLHTYKSLNYMALGEVEKARPEIIRAYQCQQDAVEENARRIEKAQAEEQECKDNDKITKARSDPKFAAALDGVTRGLEGFKFYADYVNPFTVYLDGLYFLHAGSDGSDLERASKSLNRVIEVCGDNKFVALDLETATNALAGQPVTPCTYVLFETGEAASLGQVRIDIPIVVTKVSYVGAAFPKLELHDSYAREMTVLSIAGQEATAPLASMDSIIALDFKNEFPVVVTKTMISTIAKAVAAYAVNDAANRQSSIAGLITQIGTAVAQAAVNIADTRCWTTLPKEFQVARITTPADRKLTLSVPGSAPQAVNLLDGTVNIVYAKSITANSPLLISQFKLK